MKKLISCLVIMFTLCSCGGQFYYVQVLNATCSNPSGRTDVSNPELAYSDDNCNIYYSFWGNGGDGGFVMYNKTDSIIFVDLTETFFIINGFSSPYYQARQWGESSTSTTQVSTNSSYAYSTSNTNASVFGRASASANAQATAFGNSAYGIANAIGNFSSFGTSTTNNTFHYRSFNVSNMHSVTYTQGESEMPILAIAPHSYGRASNGQIHNMLIKDCALNRWPSDTASICYDKEDSPITFSNYITYQIGKNGKTKNIFNEFFVSRVTNYAWPTIVNYIERKDTLCQNLRETIKGNNDSFYVGNGRVYDKYLMIDPQNKFYIEYDIKTEKNLYKRLSNYTYSNYYEGYVKAEWADIDV